MSKPSALTLCCCLAALPLISCANGVGGPPQAYAPPPAAATVANPGRARIYAVGPGGPAAILVMLPGPGDVLTAGPALWAAQGFDVVTPSPSEIYQLAADREAAFDRLIAAGAGDDGRTDLARRAKPGDRVCDGVDAPLRTWRGLGRRGHVDDLRRRHLQRAHDLFLFGQRSPAEGLGEQIGRLPGRLTVWLGWWREQSSDRSANAGSSPEPTTGDRGVSADRPWLAHLGSAGRRVNQIRPAGLISLSARPGPRQAEALAMSGCGWLSSAASDLAFIIEKSGGGRRRRGSGNRTDRAAG